VVDILTKELISRNRYRFISSSNRKFNCVSSTIGRGLRLAEGKDCLTVLDFVGNSRPEYDFENKFRALIGKTTSVQRN
jgi:hypothetical protein